MIFRPMRCSVSAPLALNRCTLEATLAAAIAGNRLHVWAIVAWPCAAMASYTATLMHIGAILAEVGRRREYGTQRGTQSVWFHSRQRLLPVQTKSTAARWTTGVVRKNVIAVNRVLSHYSVDASHTASRQ